MRITVMLMSLMWTTVVAAQGLAPEIVRPGQWHGDIYRIEVQAWGQDVDEAELTAQDFAVRQALGQVIVTNTRVQDQDLVRHDIERYTNGIVNHSQVLRQWPQGNGVRAHVRVDVSRERWLENFGLVPDSGTTVDVRPAQSVSRSRQRELQSGDRMLAQVLDRFPQQGFDIRVTRHDWLATDRRDMTLRLTAEVSWNQAWLRDLRQLLSETSHVGSGDPCWYVDRGCNDTYQFMVIDTDLRMGRRAVAGWRDQQRYDLLMDHLWRREPVIQLQIDTLGHASRVLCFADSRINSRAHAHSSAPDPMIQVGARRITVDNRRGIPVVLDIGIIDPAQTKNNWQLALHLVPRAQCLARMTG